MQLQHHHFKISNEIVDLGSDHQSLLKPLGEKSIRKYKFGRLG